MPDDRPAPNNTQDKQPNELPRSTRARSRETAINENPTLLDTAFILLASATIFLFLLWVVTTLAGQQAKFNDVPDWLKAAASKLWAKLSLLGGSVATFLLRKLAYKSPTPNYLLWIPGGVVFLLFLSFGIWFLVHMIAPPAPPSAATLVHVPVSFSLDRPRDPSLHNARIPDGLFWTEKPNKLNPPAGLYRGQDRIYPFSQALDFDHGQYSTAYVKMIEDEGHLEDAGNPYDYRICLSLNPVQPRGAGIPQAILRCEKGACSPALHDDPGYVVDAKCEDNNLSGSAGNLPVVYAAESVPPLRSAGWVVPSLDTLSKMTDRERVGYTKFTIRFKVNPSFAAADHYYFSLAVNGTPVYIDGLLPERTAYTLLPGQENTVEYALENLNFAGQYSGYEKLQFSLFLLQHDKVIRRQDIERNYVALRSADDVSTSNETGTFTWGGTYIIPKLENKYEILLASSDCGNPPQKSCVDRAVYAKSVFDKANLHFRDQPVVMVVRPPMPKRKKLAYGLALGLIQPTSQIQFTFDAEGAADLCHWASDQVGTGKAGRLIRPDLNRYEIATQDYLHCR